MRHASLERFLAASATTLARGPVAVLMAEDEVELASTLRHHLALGFRSLVLLAHPAFALDDMPEGRVHRIDHDVHAENALPEAVNRMIDVAAGQWLYCGYNAEYLFFPFCETRRVSDLLAFHAEERREAMFCTVVDLYAADPVRHPGGVSCEDACFDRIGYHARPRRDPTRNWEPKERQIDLFGGLRWRHEEHVAPERRRIDRIALFRARNGLRMNADFTLSDEEANTLSCPWHHNLTAAVCSFRAAKALRRNPASRQAIPGFHWFGSEPFRWNSQQLMDLGLMEPGQWF